YFYFLQEEEGIRYRNVTGIQTCALPISSSANFCKPIPNLSRSFCVLGSTAIPITGLGKSIASRTIGASSAHNVSPVRISLKPTRSEERRVGRKRKELSVRVGVVRYSRER